MVTNTQDGVAMEGSAVEIVEDVVDEWLGEKSPIHLEEFEDLKDKCIALEREVSMWDQDPGPGEIHMPVGDVLEAEGENVINSLADVLDIPTATITDGGESAWLVGVPVGPKYVPIFVVLDTGGSQPEEVYDALMDVAAEAGKYNTGRRAITDGGGYWFPSYTDGEPPENLVGEDRWFCMTVSDGRKVPMAPWVDEDPNGEPSSWDGFVGHNWPGVKTDYETAKDWADKIGKFFLATRIGDHEDRETTRLHLLDFDNVRDPETGAVHPQVREIIDRLDTYAQVSYSGTGVHAYVLGPIPEGYKQTGFEAELRDWKHSEKFEEGPEIEGYARKRFIAITEKHIDSTPIEAKERPEGIEWVYEQFGQEGDDESPEDIESTLDRDPERTQSEIQATETTGDWDVIFDAIAHTEPGFDHGNVRLDSTVTNERVSGIYDLDPSWEHSASGTRLGYDDGFIYRKSDTGLDILQVVALEERIIHSPSEYPEGEDFHDAVQAMRERGAHIPEYDPNEQPEPLSVIPLERLQALSHDEQRRHARKNGIDWPTVEEVREKVRDGLIESVENGEKTVLRAPTGSGKTHAAATEPWLFREEVTDNQPVVHVHKTKKARDEAYEASLDAGLDAKKLQGRDELCLTANGSHDPGNAHGNREIRIEGKPASDWFKHICDNQGIPFSVAHSWAEDHIEGEMPCQMHETQCPATTQFDGIPRDDSGDPSHDIIHATHQFLYVPSLRMHTNVIVDEKPSFNTDIDAERAHRAITEYLNWVDAPVDTFQQLSDAAINGVPEWYHDSRHAEGLTRNEAAKSFEDQMTEALNGENARVECPECKGTGIRKEDGVENQDLTAYPEHGGAETSNACPECDGHGEVTERRGEPPLEWYRDHPQAHTLAPALARAVWQSEDSAYKRRHARVVHEPVGWNNDDREEAAWNRVFVDVVTDESGQVLDVSQLPDFSLANSLVGMDATGQEGDPVWQADVDPDIETKFTLSNQERAMYRRYERGLHTVQVGDGVQPMTTGEWLPEGQGQKLKAMAGHLAHHFDDWSTAITSSAAEGWLRDAMEEAGVSDPETMHYGEEESRNDFAGERVGLVAGSIDPGDGTILNRCARLGYDVAPAMKDCPNCGGTGNVQAADSDEAGDYCSTCDGTGEVREHGREFVGDDAEAAEAVLQSVREHHVAQSAGRYARDAADPEDHATVFVMTEAAPEGFIDAKVDGVTWVTNEQQRERLRYVRDNPGATAKEVADACGTTKQSAYRTLRKAGENGVLERTPGEGPYGADVYYSGEEWNPYGGVDAPETEVSGSLRSGYEGYSTWTVAIETQPHVAFNAETDDGGDWPLQSTFEWFEPAGPPPESS